VLREEFTQVEQIFQYEGGIISFVEFLNKNKNMLHERPIYFQKQKDTTVVEIAMQYNDSYSENVYILPIISIRMKEGRILLVLRPRSQKSQMTMQRRRIS